jgi:hypothetical protein
MFGELKFCRTWIVEQLVRRNLADQSPDVPEVAGQFSTMKISDPIFVRWAGKSSRQPCQGWQTLRPG